MQLTPEQESTVRQWVSDGASLQDVQRGLREEFKMTLTYLEARLLAGDLGLKFVGDEPDEDETVNSGAMAAEPPASEAEVLLDADGKAAKTPGEVDVTVDAVTRPQAIVSGRVTFTDGQTTGWYLDQTGRLGLDPPTPGYRPPDADVSVFQSKLQQLLQKQGF